jgi:DNA-binding HxlR family transcriptional regulator
MYYRPILEVPKLFQNNGGGYMRSYDQFCPVAKAAELFCERWTALILRDLIGGATRFAELKRGVPNVSPTLLSRRLKELESEGVIERRRSPSGRSWTYHLTAAGREFQPLIEALGTWGQRWSRRQLQKHEVNLTLLIWALELHTNPAAFGTRTCVVRLTFTDQPSATQNWWFLNEDGQTTLCMVDPGFEVDLYLETTLPDMIYIYRGDLSLAQALDQQRFKAHGVAWARRALPRWLARSPAAHVKSQRPSAPDAPTSTTTEVQGRPSAASRAKAKAARHADASTTTADFIGR